MSNSVSIVAMTTDNFYIEQKTALKNGCYDAISKPCSPTKPEEVVLAFI